MTNLQESANQQQRQLQQRLLLGLPIGVGALLAAAISALITAPQLMRLQADETRLTDLRELQERLPLLRSQLDKTLSEQQQAKRRQQRVLQLIEGSGEFITFLAQLDREASRNRLQLELFEPVTAAAPPAVPASGGDPSKPASPPAPKPVRSPLEQAGLEAKTLLLTARGPYPSLLGFMRSVEQLSLLVVPSNFSLELVEVAPPAAPAAGSARKTTVSDKTTVPEMKLAFTYYTAPPGGLKPAQPKPAAAPPAGAPPAPPAPASPAAPPAAGS